MVVLFRCTFKHNNQEMLRLLLSLNKYLVNIHYILGAGKKAMNSLEDLSAVL